MVRIEKDSIIVKSSKSTFDEFEHVLGIIYDF